MESSFLTAVFLPLTLFIIMLGMGLGLKISDFKRIVVAPKAAILGLIAQLVMLPIMGFVLASIFPLTPELAVGVMILSACPGGATSNLMTYIARGDVALSIFLTAISSLITIFTIPLVVNFSMQVFVGEASALQLPFLTTVTQIAVITLIPVSLGMLLNHYAPRFAASVEKSVKWLSLGFLGLIIAIILYQERANIVGFFVQVGGVTLTLNVITMALGFVIAALGKLNRSATKALTIEVGIQNGTLAIAVASAPIFLNNPTMAIPPAIYSLIMDVTGFAFALWCQGQVGTLNLTPTLPGDGTPEKVAMQRSSNSDDK
ncbi:bile acid:sodium symporter family protein [Almyronema epifaneia]|uniref:Bile acid:sodium symporter family protein n=1 Tax=Almyronema epifaneia S1 TaxID=2991925 RepID=A0ABW6ICB5_9CYAN